MPNAFAFLLLLQLAGEAASRFGGLTLPGPVIGLALALVWLMAGIPLPARTKDAADGLIAHLSLLFVPAGVGVVQLIEKVAGEAGRLGIVLALSTAITMAATALTFRYVAARTVNPGAPGANP